MGRARTNQAASTGVELETGEVVETLRCDNCTELIVDKTHIICDECPETIHLCVACFTLGAQLGDHLRGHKYIVEKPCGEPIFEPIPGSTAAPWNSKEELLLIDAVERFNLGNWEGVARALNTDRDPLEVKEHYDRYYIRGKIGLACMAGFQRPKIDDQTGSVLSQAKTTFGDLDDDMEDVDVMEEDNSRASSSSFSQPAGLHPLHPLHPLGQSNPHSPPLRNSVHKIGHDDLRLLAYMPHRDDYEREWNNDAEELLTPLLPQTDDDHLDRDVKLAHVDMYLRTVAERRRRKALVRDYDLVSTFFKLEKPGLASRAWQYAPSAYAVMKRENELRDELRRFSHLLPADQMKMLVSSLSKQELLMERIVELQKLRKNGITSLPDDGYLSSSATVISSSLGESMTSGGKEDDGNMTRKRRHCSVNEEPRRASVETIRNEKPIIGGIDSVDGRRGCMKSASLTGNAMGKMLSAREIQFCEERRVSGGDFLLLKLAVLREERERALGLPQRTNVRQEIVDIKSALRSRMRTSGWLSASSIGDRGSFG